MPKKTLQKQTLHKQSEWLRVTLANVNDAVITSDSEGSVISLNPVAELTTGWTHQEAEGKPISTVFHIIDEQTRQIVDNPVTRTLREAGMTNQAVLIIKDGTERAINYKTAPISDDRDNLIGMVLIFRDVTEERRLTEVRLLQSAIVESSDDAIISKTLDGIITSWNEGAERLYGYTAKEVVGKHLSILIPADHSDDLPEIMARLKRGERISHFETKRLRKDGNQVDVSLTISPVRGADGKIIGASKIARDITARKQAEQTARFLAETSAALAELTDYGSTLQKIAGMAVPYFADWCSVHKREEDGSLRRLALAHSGSAKVQLDRYPSFPLCSPSIMKALNSGLPIWAAEFPDSILKEWAQDEEHLRPLRQLGLKSYICVPLKSRTKIFGVLTFVTGQSSRVYDANDLRVAEDLAQRAVIAIENAELLTTLKESDRRKDEFLAMLAHELRNPLAPIRNVMQILRVKNPAVSEMQWGRDIIDRQVQQMTRLIDDLLDVSRISMGRIELRKELVEVVPTVRGAIEVIRPLIEKRGLELKITIPAEPIYVEADMTRLSQVLLNLLNNAAKFTDHGGRIWVTVERMGDQVLIRVADTGIGIPREMLSSIFEMFIQLDNSLERSQGGLGIGLTLVKRLVELHGGTVEARSQGLGQGSEFVLCFPVAVKPKEQKPQGEISVQRAAPSPTYRILVVDDNQDSADSVALFLQMTGNEIRTAHDGLEAVEAAAAFQPDIVLMDIGLPKLNGYEAARRIRGQPGGSKVVLIALTGWGQEEDRRRSKEFGFDHHLTKPLDFSVLQELLVGSQKQPDRLSAKQ